MKTTTFFKRWFFNCSIQSDKARGVKNNHFYYFFFFFRLNKFERETVLSKKGTKNTKRKFKLIGKHNQPGYG